MFAVKRAANLFCPFYFWEKIMIVLVVCVPAESSWHLLCGWYVAFHLKDGQSRTVRQFQFTDWPEQGVPKSGEGFIDFIGQVHKTKEQFGQDGPISVHCR